MNGSTAKAELRQYQKLKRERAAIRRTLADTRSEGAATVDMLRQAQEAVAAELERIEKRIESLPDADERTVLRLRYICGHSWVRIASQMYYAERTVYMIHGRALRHYADNA